MDRARRDASLRLRVTSTLDLGGRPEQHLSSTDTDEVLDFLGSWLAQIRDAAVTARQRGPGSVAGVDHPDDRWPGGSGGGAADIITNVSGHPPTPSPFTGGHTPSANRPTDQ